MSYSPKDGFPYYFDLVNEIDLLPLFEPASTLSFFKSISKEKAAYRYEPSKWSIKQVVGHITDHERIKMYRAFLLSRNEKTELWGYDQNKLVENSRFDELSIDYLINDYHKVRQASISFIDSLSEAQFKIIGNARQYEITLEDFLKSIIGHEEHHVRIIKERYVR